MKQATIHLEHEVTHDRQGGYYTLPFILPEGVESLAIAYDYLRFDTGDTRPGGEGFVERREVNIIDLGLIDSGGKQVGVSGSDKKQISVSEVDATPGYRPCALTPGEWQIIVGAYLIAPGNVKVTYDITLTFKERRLLKGDLHAHTVASDGVHTVEELAWKAIRSGLDFVAITDHNQVATTAELPRVPGVTLIPGVEWTHFKGHANFLGVDKPFDTPFFTNTPEETRERFECAHSRGAVITINHPFEGGMGFQFDLNSLPYDCLEIWNGPMREANIKTWAFWHSLLAAGKKVPACGGSDYHRDTPFLFLGGPTTWVYAMSTGPSDILAAVSAGHSYITFAPGGPQLTLTAGEAIVGDSVPWSEVHEAHLEVTGLQAGDVVQVVTSRGADVLLTAQKPGSFSARYAMPAPGFARVEVLRAFLPGVPLLPALISNPIYFDA